MSVIAKKILEQFSNQLSHLAGPLDSIVDRPAAWESPKTNCVIYAAHKEALETNLKGPASLIIIDEKLKESVPNESKICIFSCADLQLIMAHLNTHFFTQNLSSRAFDGEKIHPSAVLSKSAQIGEDCIIGPNVCIEAGAQIGSSTFIGANSYIGPNTKLGNECIIEANVSIGHDCIIGNKCRIQPMSVIGSDGYGYATNKIGQHSFKPHYGRVILGDFVEIGANVCIDRGTYNDSTIGEGTKIDNLCHFGHNIKMGKHCIVTAGFISAGSATVGDYCVFGGRATIGGHIKIASQTMIAGLSGVTRSISKAGKYGGFPAIELKDCLKAMSSFRHLPELRKSVAKLLKESSNK